MCIPFHRDPRRGVDVRSAAARGSLTQLSMAEAQRDKVYIDNEVEALRRVVVRRPGAEIERMTQHELERLLFDDILSPTETGREHDIMVEILRGGGDAAQGDGKQEAGYGIADNDKRARPYIKAAAVPHCFLDAKRNGNQIDQQGCPETKGDGYGKLLNHQIDDAFIPEITLAKIKNQVVFNHQEKTFMGRFIKSELDFQLLDKFRIQALRAAILGRHAVRRGRAAAARRGFLAEPEAPDFP